MKPGCRTAELGTAEPKMTATLTYTLVLAAIYFGIKAMEVIEQKD